MKSSKFKVQEFKVHTAANVRALVPLSLVLLCFVLSLPAWAQQSGGAAPSRLDDARFIQGLRERGMRELLLYFLEKNPPKDPVVRLEYEIEQHKLIAQDAKAEPDRRKQAMDDVLATYRKLFKEAPRTHAKQPIWKTDFAEYVLQFILPVAHTNAGEFVEFGVPTRAQRDAFNSHVGEVLTVLEDAAVDHFMLVGDLPKRDGFQEQYVNNGFWRTFMEEYGQIKLPYYRAWANYWGGYLVKPAGSVGEAATLIKGVMAQPISPAAEPELKSLAARIALKQNQADEAHKLLDEVIAMEGAAPFNVLVARLAKSQALHAAKKDKEALAQIEQARQLDVVNQSPMLLVLTYDRQFKITGDPQTYITLFNDPAAATNRAAIESFVKGRLVEDKQLTVAEMAKAEPFIVLANVDALSARGGQLQQKASVSAGNAAEQKKLLAEAGQAFNDARTGLQQLLKRKGLPENAVAEARLKLGAAEYQLGNRPGAIQAWVDLANDMPQQKLAEAAAVNAFLVSRKQWQDNQKHPDAVRMFDQAQHVLLTKFPHARVGDDPVSIHWHTRAAFLRQVARHQDAIDAFNQFITLNPDHALVPDALYQVLLSAHELYRAAPPKERGKFADQVIAAAKRAVDGLTAAAQSADADKVQTLSYQRGDAILRHAEVLSEGKGQHSEAQTLLAGYDEQFAQFPDLVRAKRELLVNILVGFGQVAEAKAEVQKFIAQFPDQGGSMMSQVLAAINRQVDDLTRAGRADEAKQRAAVGVDFALFLMDWARKQPEYKDPKKLTPFTLLLAQQYASAGQDSKALELYNQLYKTPEGQSNLQVIHGLARTLFRLSRYDDALPLVNTILRLAPDQAAAEVWDSWLMRLTILDRQVDQQRKGTAETPADPAKADKTSRTIFTTIAKLKANDPNLGGPAYKPELERLQNKHFPR